MLSIGDKLTCGKFVDPLPPTHSKKKTKQKQKQKQSKKQKKREDDNKTTSFFKVF